MTLQEELQNPFKLKKYLDTFRKELMEEHPEYSENEFMIAMIEKVSQVILQKRLITEVDAMVVSRYIDKILYEAKLSRNIH